MEQFLSPRYGIAGICVLLTLQILIRVGEFLWQLREKKEALSETTLKELITVVRANTLAVHHLEQRMMALEKVAADTEGLRRHIQRFYSALREVAGDKWPKVRDEMMKDEFSQ